jgi:hypothetical protein
MGSRFARNRIVATVVAFFAIVGILLLLSHRELRPTSDYDEIEIGRSNELELIERFGEPIHKGLLSKPIPEPLKIDLIRLGGVDSDTIIVLHYWFDDARTRYFEVLLADNGVVINKSSLIQVPRKRWYIEELLESIF